MSGQPIVSALSVTAEETPSDRIAALFNDHHQRIYRLARRLTSTADDALDLVQETFLRAARAPNSVPIGANQEEAWLVRVLINLRRDQWRKSSTRMRGAREDRSDREIEVQLDHGSAVIARATVWRALDRLSPRRRAVIVMHELEGLDVRTVASQLGISAITVRWHLAAGRRDLTRLITRNGDRL